MLVVIDSLNEQLNLADKELNQLAQRDPVHRHHCGRAQARRCPVCTLARRHPVRSEPRDQKERRCGVVSRGRADQSLPVLRTGQRPNNGCPEAVSASAPFQAPAPRRLPRFDDCAPPTDFHLCVTTNAHNRFRQPVARIPGQPCTGRTAFPRGRRTTLSWTVGPPHNRSTAVSTVIVIAAAHLLEAERCLARQHVLR